LSITVIGLGKIGLPLAVYFTQESNVIGLDSNHKVVELVNLGQEPFPGESNLQKLLEAAIRSNKLSATQDQVHAISNADTILICIPLITNKNNMPDFNNIDLVVRAIGKNIKKGTLISFETTLPVGTTRNRFTKIIEQESGFKVGQDFFVVFSPERVLTGRIFEDLSKYPKLVGGVTSSCTIKGVEFYNSVLKFPSSSKLNSGLGVFALGNCETAEFAKIAETTYRDVNIGLANEFAIYAKKFNIDFQEVIKAANSQPYSHIHTPGISVGGHCIPVYPHFYLSDFSNSTIVSSARILNKSMPQYAVGQIKQSFPSLKNMSIGILGLTYRPGVKETAFSGALDLLELLRNESSLVYGYDPLLGENEIIELGFKFKKRISDLDGIILHTEHLEFSNLDFHEISTLKFIYDGRNFYPNLKKTKNNFIYLNL
jgi:nucleotide sugar dehydrogenase